MLGSFTTGKMAVEVVLAPRNVAQRDALLAQLYAPGRNTKMWMPKGRYNAMFAPTSAQIGAVQAFLRQNGMTIQPTRSPFFVRASGPSQAVSAAFKTRLYNFRNRHGITYFSNVDAVQMPASLVPFVRGVIGLSNTVRPQPQYRRAPGAKRTTPATPSCQEPYPTLADFYNAVVNGTPIPFGYGAGPGCNGLTPSQTNGIYGAPNVGPSGQGAGVNMAVFELSAYQQADIVTYVQTFYGGSYNPPLIDVPVDGGPLDPVCPDGDECQPASGAYFGDIEVDADIETQLAVAPAAANLYVYNAPNDETGQTELDEYSQIASDDLADSVSSSWAECEQDVGSDYAIAEYDIFAQMALQGQSMFGAQGDTGAFGCLRSDGTTGLAVIDPPAQPWVTSVGGTSFPTFNPGYNLTPVYPTGAETVWNVDGLCNAGAGFAGIPGLEWCELTGATGGGNSLFWGRPSYQNIGFGINNPFTVFANKTTNCIIAPSGTPCREVPDVSANADEYTPYAEYCTSNDNTPGSSCSPVPNGWFGIGGTSLSSPLWSAVIGDRVGLFEQRFGNVNGMLYLLSRINGRGYFHDMTGTSQNPNNNGFFPTTPGYDMTTGLGTPRMAAIITGQPTH